ncbi:MAG: endonuclease/exonuclease/phosphatase family metal-dependent hydrolase [Kiritimatiellia bacterium]|jgi:endonuclease/exonuclease/phosphatase family metal-dependent hydrolase
MELLVHECCHKVYLACATTRGHMFRPLPFLLLMILPMGCPQPASVDTDKDSETTSTRPARLRVATWNIQGVGRPSSDQFAAAVQVINRLDADVLGLNEIDSNELVVINDLAKATGFSHVFVPDDNPFGGLRNAIFSKHPFERSEAWTSATVSGDSRANDVTRLPVSAEIKLPNNPHPVRIIAQHWKSGFDLSSRFRRAADGYRTASAAVRDAPVHVIVFGDVNAVLSLMPEDPDPWTYKPTDNAMPSGWAAGPDLQAELDGPGLRNDAFHYLQAQGLEPLEALQLDGRDATRPVSGKRIDYVFASASIRALQPVTEVYDCTDEGDEGALPKVGDTPPRQACADASDHLPVLLEVVLPAQ